jgi:hypothetical protein
MGAGHGGKLVTTLRAVCDQVGKAKLCCHGQQLGLNIALQPSPHFILWQHPQLRADFKVMCSQPV